MRARALHDREQCHPVHGVAPHLQHPPHDPLAETVHARGQHGADHVGGPQRQLHGGDEQPVLGLEVVVDERRVDIGVGRHVAHPRAVVSVRGEPLAGGGEDRVARVAGAGAATAPPARGGTHPPVKSTAALDSGV